MKNNTFMAVGNVCKEFSLKAMLLIVALLCGLGGAVAQTQSSDSIYYVYRNTGEGIYALPDSLLKSF